jgi:tetratricopeptide (TPR) repeat protein
MPMPGPAPKFPPPVPIAPMDATAHDVEPTHFFADQAGPRPGASEPPSPEAREKFAKELVAACEKELAKQPDPLRAGRLHYEVARAYEGVLDDLERAREHYFAARERLADHLPTLAGSRRVLIALGRHADALPLFDAEARLIADPQRKAMLLYEKGVVLEDRLRQGKEARRAYSAALDLDESNPTILKAFERACALSSEWDDLDRAFEREANAVSSDARHRAAVLSERARLADAKKSNAERAIELYQMALGVDPRAPGALAGLKSLLYAHERFRDLITVLEHEAHQATDPETRALARYRVARLQVDRLGALDEAILSLEKAVADVPGDAMILGELARLYELGKRWGKLTTVLETMAATTASPGERVALMHRIAQIAEDRLGNVDQAMDWYRRALDGDPAYVPALQALGKLYADREHWTALIAMHLGDAGATKDTTRRAENHARVAEILERRLGNVDQAIEHHTHALAMVPGYAASFKALVRLYSQGGRFRELGELYERAVDVATDADTKITYLFKIGRLHEDALGAPLAAVAAYKRILAIDSGHLGAIHAIQRAAERGEDWTELVAALDREADEIHDKAVRAALLHRAAEVVEERLGDAEGAVGRLRAVLALDAKYTPALSSLGRLYYRAGRFEDLLATYELELAVTPSGAPSAALLYKMGELAEERVGRDDDAIRHYKAAIAADPRHLTALRALVRLEGGRGAWPEVVRLLEIEERALDDEGARARTVFRSGEVYEHQLGDRVRALEAYERALGFAPDFRPALDGRSRLLERAKDYRSLVDALDREATTSKDPGLSVVARLRQAEVLRDHVNQPEKAVEAYEAVLAVDPNHIGALLALEPLYAGLGATDKLNQCLLAEARIVENGLARIAVLRELARLEELRVAASPSEVAEKYLTIVRVAPSDTSALSALERVALGQKNWPLLAQVDAKLAALVDEPTVASAHQTRLAEAMELAGEPSALDSYRAAIARDGENVAASRGFARLAERALDPTLLEEASGHVARVLRDPERAASLLVRSAQVRKDRLRDPVTAATELERALEICPDHVDAALRLSDILVAANDFGRLADALSHAASRAKDPERRASLWVTVAGLHGDRRGDVGAGLSALGRALKDLPNHVPALLKEAEFFAREGRAAEAVTRLERVVARATDPAVLLEAHVLLAELLDTELTEPAKAAQHLQAALKIQPNHRSSLAMLVELQMRREQFEAAAETAARLVEVCADGAERADALTRLARLERRQGSMSEAIDAYRQAVAITGIEGPALEEMRALLNESLGAGPAGWEAYADALTRHLDRNQEQDQRLVAVYLDLARILADVLQHTERAVQTLRAAVARFGREPRLRSELAVLYKKMGRTAEAAEELRRLVDLEPLRLDVWSDLAETLRALGRTDLATVAGEVLVALGGGTDRDRLDLENRVLRVAAVPAGSFDPETLRLLDAALSEDHATTRLIASTASGLERAYAPDFEAYGISRGDRISPRAGHPTRLLADRVARIFGVESFDLYVHQAHAGGVEIEISDPVAVMVPAQVTTLSEGQQAFLLARVFANIARGLFAVDKLPPQGIGELAIAAMRIVDPTFGAGQAEEEYVETLSKSLYRGLPRRARRPLEEAALAYGPSPKPRLEDWILRVKKTATRAALLVSGDAAGAIAVLRRTEGDLARLDRATADRGMVLIADALRFAVSDVAATVRRRVGLG